MTIWTLSRSLRMPGTHRKVCPKYAHRVPKRRRANMKTAIYLSKHRHGIGAGGGTRTLFRVHAKEPLPPLNWLFRSHPIPLHHADLRRSVGKMWARFDLSGPAIHHLFTGTGVLANFRRTSGQLAARGSPGSAAGSLLELLGQKPQNGACTPRRATNKSPALGGGGRCRQIRTDTA
jgi:hypothetical protein